MAGRALISLVSAQSAMGVLLSVLESKMAVLMCCGLSQVDAHAHDRSVLNKPYSCLVIRDESRYIALRLMAKSWPECSVWNDPLQILDRDATDAS